MNVQENVSLAPLTTMKVGGPARYFVENKTIAEVQGAVAFGRSRNLPLFVLGGGSNLVVSDAGWPGLVLKVGITGIDERNENGKAIFDVGAGEEWDKFAARAVARNCAGVECLSGIPGSVGGTPVQNVGAYGQEAAETIESVLTLDLRDDQIRELCGEACGFSYRTSIFNTSERGCYIILRVTYGLTPGGQPRIDYADLKRHFSGWQQIPTLADTREAVRRIRASKAMLITPGDADARSVGSFFKNPVLSSEQHEDLSRRAAARGLQIPFGFQQRVRQRACGDFEQTRVGDCQSRWGDGGRCRSFERTHSAPGAGNLEYLFTTGACLCGILILEVSQKTEECGMATDFQGRRRPGSRP